MAKGESTRWWSIAMLDIVGYSDLSEDEQRKAIKHLTAVVRRCRVLRKTKSELRIFLPTGDGMAIGFSGLPEAPLELASEVHRAYGSQRFQLTIGIHAGIAFEIRDINGNRNIAGSGINWAQRTLSCCSKGHILVAAEPGEMLAKLEAWGSQLRGPYLFRVKHGRELRAYNLVDEAGDVGNQSEPLANRVFHSDYQPLRARLEKLGLGPSGSLGDSELARLRDPIAIGTVVLEGAINGFSGVPPSHVETVVRDAPRLPRYVLKCRKEMAKPSFNGAKVYLADWEAPLSDAGERLVLHVGFSDFWTTCAVEKSASMIQGDIASGRLDLFQFPRQLDCHVVVVAADEKVILLRRTKDVRYDKRRWCAVGESIDGEKDLNADGRPDPLLTVKRALGKEELGLPTEAVERAVVKFVAITTEWHAFHSQLVTVARLTLESRAVKDCWLGAKDREHTDFDAFEFSPARCLEVIRQTRHSIVGQPNSEDVLVPTSKMALLAALCSEHGYGAVLEGIAALH